MKKIDTLIVKASETGQTEICLTRKYVRLAIKEYDDLQLESKDTKTLSVDELTKRLFGPIKQIFYTPEEIDKLIEALHLAKETLLIDYEYEYEN